MSKQNSTYIGGDLEYTYNMSILLTLEAIRGFEPHPSRFRIPRNARVIAKNGGPAKDGSSMMRGISKEGRLGQVHKNVESNAASIIKL